MRIAIVENGEILTVVEATSLEEVEQTLAEGQTARPAAYTENAEAPE